MRNKLNFCIQHCFYGNLINNKQLKNIAFFNKRQNCKISEFFIKPRKISKKTKYQETVERKKNINNLMQQKLNCKKEDAINLVENFNIQEKHDSIVFTGFMCQNNPKTNNVELSKEHITITHTLTSKKTTNYIIPLGNNNYKKIIVRNDFVCNHATTNKPIYLSNGIININPLSNLNKKGAIVYDYNNFKQLNKESYLYQFLNHLRINGINVKDKNVLLNYLLINHESLIMLENINLSNNSNDFLISYSYSNFNKDNTAILALTTFLKN